jgi:phosphate transport system substrate-binding protein
MRPQAVEVHSIATLLYSWVTGPGAIGAVIAAFVIAVGSTSWRRITRKDRRIGWTVLYDEPINQGDPDSRRRARVAAEGQSADLSDHMWDIIYRPKIGQGSYEVTNGSLVILELRNIGQRALEPEHFGTHGTYTVGFPSRKVVHFKVRDNPDPDSADYHRQVEDYYDALEQRLGRPPAEPGTISSLDLPGPKINARLGFKVLILLAGDSPGEGKGYPEPTITTQITDGKFVRQSIARRSRWWLIPGLALAVVLAVACVAVGIVLDKQEQTPQAKCASGQLDIEGSTAFAPVMNQAVALYEQECPQAQVSITIQAVGSVQGLENLEQSSPDGTPIIAMYDGIPAANVGASFHATPVGIVIFAVVANRSSFSPSLFETGSGNGLSAADIGQAFTSRAVGDMTFRPVGRTSDSGTRLAFDQDILFQHGYSDPTTSSTPDCPPAGTSAVTGLCQEPTTMDLLGYVNATNDAIGYAEADAVPFFPNVGVIPIGGFAPDKTDVLDGCYPFYASEHLYTRGAPTGLEKDVIDFLTSSAVTTQLRNASSFIPLSDGNSPGSTCSPSSS